MLAKHEINLVDLKDKIIANYDLGFFYTSTNKSNMFAGC